MASTNPTLNSMALLKGWVPLWTHKRSRPVWFLTGVRLWLDVRAKNTSAVSPIIIIILNSYTHLFNHIEGKLEALSLQHGDEVLKEDGKMLMPISKWNQDRHLQINAWNKSEWALCQYFITIFGWNHCWENLCKWQTAGNGNKMYQQTFQRGRQSLGFQWPPNFTPYIMENFTSSSSSGISVMLTSIDPSVRKIWEEGALRRRQHNNGECKVKLRMSKMWLTTDNFTHS